MTQNLERARSDAFRIVVEIIVEELAIPEEEITPDTHFVHDLRVDSDDLTFGYVPAVHKRFGVVLSNAEWLKVGTPQETVDAVLEARARQGVPGPLTPSVDPEEGSP